MTAIHLPYPISANRYWRRFGHSIVISAEAKDYKKMVGWLVKSVGQKVIQGDVAVSITLQPKLTKKGAESKTRMDLDNCIKVTLDALNNVAYADDSQVVAIDARIAGPVANGGLIVDVRSVLDGVK